MADYLLLSTGKGKMPETEEEQKAFMDAWGAWMGGLGAALKDGGNPFNPGATKTIDPSGSVSDGSPVDASGYLIITADSLDAATEMAKTCPVLLSGNTINLFETVDMMGG